MLSILQTQIVHSNTDQINIKKAEEINFFRMLHTHVFLLYH